VRSHQHSDHVIPIVTLLATRERKPHGSSFNAPGRISQAAAPRRRSRVALTVVVGFNWLHYGFGWTLGGTAETMASHRVDVALVAAYTPVCVEKFVGPADDAKWEEFAKVASWSPCSPLLFQPFSSGGVPEWPALPEAGGAQCRLSTASRRRRARLPSGYGGIHRLCQRGHRLLLSV
jgi:hypothetical protein